MKRIAILGASLPQRKLVEQAKKMSLETHVFAWKDGNIVEDIADFFHPISTLDKEGILKKCKEIQIDGILTVGSDIAIESVNFVAKALSLVGNSLETTKLSRDKHLMRSAFRENQIPSISFELIQKESDLTETHLKYPFMVKATDRSGSRGVTYVTNLKEAKQAYQDAYDISLNKKVIIEEYFEGTQYSIEMISQKGNHYFVGVTEEFYTGKPYFVEKAHVVPGRIDKENLLKAVEITKQALNTLNIKNGASHTELRINKNKEFCIIEIAARMGGDFRAEMVEYAYGYNYMMAAIKVALGEKIETAEVYNTHKFSFVKWLINENDKKLLNNLNSYNIFKVQKFDHEKNQNIESSENRHGFILGGCGVFPNIVEQ